MSQGRDILILKPEWKCFVDRLTNTEAGQLFKLIHQYSNGNQVKIGNKLLDMMMTFIGRDIEAIRKSLRLGKYSHLWKGGVSTTNKLIRNGKEIKQWRKEVFERDKFACQICFKTGGTLHAHHIKEFSKFPELRFEINNGLTVCKSCHHKIHTK